MTEQIELEKRIRELEWQIKQLEHDLIHDPLTGLKTRAFFEEEVGLYLDIIRQQDEPQQSGALRRKERFGFKHLSVVFFDIDHFKKVNDTHGHDTGDIVLQRVARAIKSSVRAGDTVARWGGEEMVANLLGAREADALAKAEEIREKIAQFSFPEVPELRVTISAGVATSETGANLIELVKRADQALYKAKETGRNKVISYSNSNGN